MNVGILVGICFGLVLGLLFLMTKDYRKVESEFRPESVNLLFEKLLDAVKHVRKTLPTLLEKDTGVIRQNLLAIWYWYAFEGAKNISPEQNEWIRELWNEQDKELKLEASDAYAQIPMMVKYLLDTHVSAVIDKYGKDKDILFKTLKIIACSQSFKNCCKHY